jgi:cysteinyl-tRNA synthetase
MIDTIFKNEEIDIHGGGYDLKFPHHENEIAQSTAMHNNKIAKFWMHNAFINFGTEKMSKSLGNVVYAKDMIDEVGGPITRLVILSAHYRQPVNFTEDTVKAATQEVNKMVMAYKQAALKLQLGGKNIKEGKPLYISNFVNALADDLNTANALAELYNVLKEINQTIRVREPDLDKLNDLFKTLTDMFTILGLDIKYVELGNEELDLYNSYLKAKEEKDYVKSDEIRQQLIAKGIM